MTDISHVKKGLKEPEGSTPELKKGSLSRRLSFAGIHDNGNLYNKQSFETLVIPFLQIDDTILDNLKEHIINFINGRGTISIEEMEGMIVDEKYELYHEQIQNIINFIKAIHIPYGDI